MNFQLDKKKIAKEGTWFFLTGAITILASWGFGMGAAYGLSSGNTIWVVGLPIAITFTGMGLLLIQKKYYCDTKLLILYGRKVNNK